MRALALPCGPRSLYRYITPQTVSCYGASSGVTFSVADLIPGLDDQSHVIVFSNQTFLQDGRQFVYTQSRHTLDKFYFSDVAPR